MKKGKEKLKLLLTFLLGVLVTSSVVYAVTLYSATEVSYDNSNSGTTKTDVQGAVDELYELSKTHCPDGYTCKETTGVELLIAKANDIHVISYSNGNVEEMYTFFHEATAQTTSQIDYRYIGSSPNNYITFNNEPWRIIGVFDGRIKIIREERINDTNLSWDYKQNGVGSSTSSNGSNDWSDSQLMYMLNPTTYTLKTGYRLDGNYIKDANGKIIYQLGCLPAIANGTSYSCTANTWSLKSEALSQIDTVTYYLGGRDWNDATHYGSTEENYESERGTNVYSGRPTTWEGQVGLMYPSDYGYTFAKGVDDICYSDVWGCEAGNPSASWIYKSEYTWWTISRATDTTNMYRVNASGGMSRNNAKALYGVRPVAYLKPEIKLTGTGTETNPYQLVG